MMSTQGQSVSHLFKRAVSTWQSNKPASSACHLNFALMHRLDDDLYRTGPKTVLGSPINEAKNSGLTDSTFQIRIT